jgi:hypothetical protein
VLAVFATSRIFYRASGFVLAVFATSRIFYRASGFLLAKFVPTSSHQLTTSDVPPGPSVSGHIVTVSTMSRSLWTDTSRLPGTLSGLFPMYPLLVRSISEVFGGSSSKEAVSYWGPLPAAQRSRGDLQPARPDADLTGLLEPSTSVGIGDDH